MALDDYLLGLDFVVHAQMGPSRSMPRTLRILSVILGTLPDSQVTLVHGPGLRAQEDQRVLAWGTWSGARGDTCYGNAMVIGPEGQLGESIAGATMLLDGVSVGGPGTYERLRERLSLRRLEHPLEWLAGGRSVELVKIASIHENRRLLGIESLRRLAGHAAAKTPATLELSRRQCRFIPSVGDSLIIALPEAPSDTLLIPVCLQRLQLRGVPYGGTVIGVPLDQVDRVLVKAEAGLELLRFHGIRNGSRLEAMR